MFRLRTDEEASIQKYDEVVRHSIRVNTSNGKPGERVKAPFLVPNGRSIVKFAKVAEVVSNTGENNTVTVEWGKHEDGRGYEVDLVASIAGSSGSIEAYVDIYLEVLGKTLRPVVAEEFAQAHGQVLVRVLAQENKRATEQAFEIRPIASLAPAASLKPIEVKAAVAGLSESARRLEVSGNSNAVDQSVVVGHKGEVDIDYREASGSCASAIAANIQLKGDNNAVGRSVTAGNGAKIVIKF